jgi:hypothetical protein
VANLGLATVGTAATAGCIVAAVAVYAAVGAVVAAVGSIIQQGLFIALGYQEKFSWKQVSHAAIAGAITGAASGVGEFAQVAAKAGELTAAGAQYARIASAALNVAGEASKQLLDNGKITSWVGLATSAVSGYAQASSAISKGASDLSSVASAADKASYASAAASAANVANVTNYVTPWANLAETAIRNGKLTPGDWAGAVGATLSTAVVDHYGAQLTADQRANGETQLSFDQELYNSSLRLGTQTLVAGGLSAVNKDQAKS